MQLTVEIPYEQLIAIIRHLPSNQRAKIKADLELSVPVNDVDIKKTEFQEFLLRGPVMSDEQYSAFKENRKAFNKWRSK